MEKNKGKKLYIVFIILFIVLNIFNAYFLTLQILNRYIQPTRRTFIGELNGIIGNFSILFLFIYLSYLIFNKDKSRLRFLLIITLILNVLIFGLSFFNLFYGTAFDRNSFKIFKNPADGMATGMGLVVLSELFVNFRILIFIPFITLLIIFIKYKKVSDNSILKLSAKKTLIGFMSFIILFFSSTLIFTNTLHKDIYALNATTSTSALQNYGVYPFYLTNFLGNDYYISNRKALNLTNDQDLITNIDKYNKNKEEYINLLDGKTYSNNLKAKDSILDIDSLNKLNLNPEDSLTGIFKDKNLVLVHLESLNYFLWEIEDINERFNFINTLLDESVVFENYYTSVGMGVSSDAEASVLSGMYMNGYETLYWEHGKNNLENEKSLTNNFVTLPKKFAEKNYKTMAIHGDEEMFYNRKEAYKDLIGFNKTGLHDYYYSLEDFYKDDPNFSSYKNTKDYKRKRMTNGYEYKGRTLISPWPSEFELSDKTMAFNQQFQNEGSNSMIYSIYMMPHTPFMFNPYKEEAYEKIYSNNYLGNLTKKYIEYVRYVDETVESYFFDFEYDAINDKNINKKSKIDTNTVYVFYSDHGSSLKNGDLSKLYNKNLNLLDERRILQQTISFIYAPSTEIDPNTNLNKGLLKGRQTLTRGHIDLYRTIGDLFGLFDESDFYFGVHGLSKEPTYVIDNRIQDLVIDNVDKINTNNYTPYFTSIRNPKKGYPQGSLKNSEQIIQDIINFKRLSDLLINDKEAYYIYKKALQNK